MKTLTNRKPVMKLNDKEDIKGETLLEMKRDISR